MVGCSIEQARGLSARSAVAFVAKALPERLLEPFRYSNSLLGLGGNTEYLARESRYLTLHLGSPVIHVRPLKGRGYRIRNAAGVSEDVDIVIFATPPYVTGPLLANIAHLRKARRVLEQFEFFRAEVTIHLDGVYMPRKRRFWSAYNPHFVDGTCEASIWYGALRPRPKGQRPLSLFKSWATSRSEAPREEVFRRSFRHPLITPKFIQAQRKLAPYQGRNGIWFAGSYNKEIDSQEAALLSAIDVVRSLFPASSEPAQASMIFDLEAVTPVDFPMSPS